MFSRWFKLGLPAQGVLSKKWGYRRVLGKKCPSGKASTCALTAWFLTSGWFFLRANENRIEYRESGNAVHGVSVSTGNHYSTRSNFNT
jgi:hypothetical protein